MSERRDARHCALLACRTLVAAYKAGGSSGASIEWFDLECVYRQAIEALKLDKAERRTRP